MRHSGRWSFGFFMPGGPHLATRKRSVQPPAIYKAELAFGFLRHPLVVDRDLPHFFTRDIAAESIGQFAALFSSGPPGPAFFKGVRIAHHRVPQVQNSSPTENAVPISAPAVSLKLMVEILPDGLTFVESFLG